MPAIDLIAKLDVRSTPGSSDATEPKFQTGNSGGTDSAFSGVLSNSLQGTQRGSGRSASSGESSNQGKDNSDPPPLRVGDQNSRDCDDSARDTREPGDNQQALAASAAGSTATKSTPASTPQNAGSGESDSAARSGSSAGISGVSGDQLLTAEVLADIEGAFQGLPQETAPSQDSETVPSAVADEELIIPSRPTPPQSLASALFADNSAESPPQGQATKNASESAEISGTPDAATSQVVEPMDEVPAANDAVPAEVIVNPQTNGEIAQAGEEVPSSPITSDSKINAGNRDKRNLDSDPQTDKTPTLIADATVAEDNPSVAINGQDAVEAKTSIDGTSSDDAENAPADVPVKSRSSASEETAEDSVSSVPESPQGSDSNAGEDEIARFLALVAGTDDHKDKDDRGNEHPHNSSVGQTTDSAPDNGQQAENSQLLGDAVPGSSRPGQTPDTGRPAAVPANDSARLVGHVAHSIQVAHSSGQEMQLRLHPPELGALRIDVSVRDGAVTARLETQTSAAQRILTDSLPQLRDALAQQGLNVDRIEVQQSDAFTEGRADLAGRSFGQEQQNERNDHWLPESPLGEDSDANSRSTTQSATASRRWGVLKQLDVTV